jgi:ATP-dependent Clp protease ATP-binding subunit ClpA
MAVKIAKENNNKLVVPTHLYLAILTTKNFGAYKILEECDFDREKVIENLKSLL